MAEANPPRTRRRKRWLVGIGIVAALVVAGALAARYVLRAENLTAMLIGQTRSMLGAELVLDGVAKFSLWPDLHLALPKPRLRAPASGNILVGAEAIDISVPWHSLWRDRVDIKSIRLVHPVIDLDAVAAWRAGQPAGGAAPDVRFALHIINGELHSAGKTIASGIDARFANSGDLAAWFNRVQADATKTLALPPLSGNLDAKSIDIGTTHIEGLHIEISDDAAAPPHRDGDDR